MFFGSLSHPLRERPARSRVQVFFRVDAQVLAERLPPGLRPRTWRGVTLGELRFTRLHASSALLRPLSSKADHYSCRFAVEKETPAGPLATTWVSAYESSSWLETFYGQAVGRSGKFGSERSRFWVRDDEDSVHLAIAGDHGIELRLRAEPAPRSTSMLFASPFSVCAFLESGSERECFDAIELPKAELGHSRKLVPEPLNLSELEAQALDDFPPEALAIESAWRWTSRQRMSVQSRTLRQREAPVPVT